MSLREGPNQTFSVVSMIGRHEYEAGPFRSAAEANQAQADLIEQLRLLKLAKSDPHLSDLLQLFTGPRPAMEQVMMAAAHLMALRSTCARLRVGCVITDTPMTTILSVGYNGNFRGGPNACDRVETGNCGCLHAEDNALVKLSTERADLLLFTTHSPCPMCSKRIANQGKIVTVYYDVRYRDDEGLHVLSQAGVNHLNLG